MAEVTWEPRKVVQWSPREGEPGTPMTQEELYDRLEMMYVSEQHPAYGYIVADDGTYRPVNFERGRVG